MPKATLHRRYSDQPLVCSKKQMNLTRRPCLHVGLLKAKVSCTRHCSINHDQMKQSTSNNKGVTWELIRRVTAM